MRLDIDQADHQRHPPARIKFKYVNWRGGDHEYIIDCESVEFGPYDNGGKNNGPSLWVLHGRLVTRDGDPRKDLYTTRRRTFIMNDMRDVESA